VEVKNQDISEDGNERPDYSDLTHRRSHAVPAIQDRGKWDTGGSLRELGPTITEPAASLRIDSNGAAEGQNE
jgi:hypothetical protein